MSFRGAGPIGKVGEIPAAARVGKSARYWPMTMDEQHLSNALPTRKEAAQFIERERYGWDPNGGHRIKPGQPGYNVYDDEGEFEERTRTPAEARAYLATRYDEQALKFPLMRKNIDKAGYIRTNLKAAQHYSVKVGSSRSKGARTTDRAARRRGVR